MTETRRILVVDDEESLRHMLSLTLSKAGFQVWTAGSGEEGLEALRKNDPFDLCLSDIRMPGMDGLAFVEQGLRLGRGRPTFIAMSAYGDEQVAVEALRRGAFDYVSKPFEGDDLLMKLRLVLEKRRLENERPSSEDSYPRAPHGTTGLDDVISVADSMERVFRVVRKVASYPTTVLLTGETGTGKERVASAIHREGRRASEPFVPVNCAAIPDALLESELFGHAKGAFTDAVQDRPGLFEVADGGTLFLDEVAELPVTLQVKLLRALVEKEIRRVGDHRVIPVDVRVIAATSQDLEAMVRAGTFRQDLFYRLNVVSIHLPPLRHRQEDIPVLAQHFVERLGQRLGLAQPCIEPEAVRLLRAYDWPGNVRELENAIERALVLSESEGRITSADLDGRFSGRPEIATSDLTLPGGDDQLSLKVVLPKVERALIRKALAKTRGSRVQAAALLGISQRALLYKMKEYDIS
ncbi:MAG: sigma-54-dependent transcriptional regulator [Myxococcota bacterium]